MDRRRDSGGQGWAPQGKSVSSYASLASGPPPSYAQDNPRDFNDMPQRPQSPPNRKPFYGNMGGRGGGRYDNRGDRSFRGGRGGGGRGRGGDRFGGGGGGEGRQMLQSSSPDRSGYESGEISPVQQHRPSISDDGSIENSNNRRLDDRMNHNDGGRDDTSGRYIPRGGGRGFVRGGRGYRGGGRYFGGRGRGRSDYHGRGRGNNDSYNSGKNWNSNPRNVGVDDSDRYPDQEPPSSRPDQGGPRFYGGDPNVRKEPMYPREPQQRMGRYSSMVNDSEGPPGPNRMDDRFGKRRRDDQGFQSNDYEDKRNRPNDFMQRGNNPMHPRNDGPRQGGDHRGSFDSSKDNIGGPPPQSNYDDPRGHPNFQRNDSRTRLGPMNDQLRDHEQIPPSRSDGPRGPGPHRDDPRGPGLNRDDPRGPPGPHRDDPRGPPGPHRDDPRGPPGPHRDDPRGPPGPHRDDPRGPPGPRRDDPRGHHQESNFQRHGPRQGDPRDDQRGQGMDGPYDDAPQMQRGRPMDRDMPMDNNNNNQNSSQASWSHNSQQSHNNMQSSYTDFANPPNRNEWNSSQGNRPSRLSPVPPQRHQGPPLDQGPPYPKNNSPDNQSFYPNNRGPPYDSRGGGYGGRGRGRGYRGGRGGRGRGGFGRFNHNSNNYFQNSPGPRDGPDMKHSSSYRSLDDGWNHPNDGFKDEDQTWSSSSGKFSHQDHDYNPQKHDHYNSDPPPSSLPVDSQDGGREMRQKNQDKIPPPETPKAVKDVTPKEEVIEKPKQPSPPPVVKPSGVMVALTRLADLEAQLEFAFAKHMQLVKKQKELDLQTKVLTKLPVGIKAFKEDLDALN